METVFLNSDIARMVLGYLRKQRLDKAAEVFCRTSPFLEKEYEVLKQGYRLFGFKEDLLETIIKEYCKITTKVDKAIELMPLSVRDNLQQKNLSAKVSSLIHHHHTHSSPLIINENKENTSAANKRKRISTGSTDCDIQFANDDSMLPPATVIKRPRMSRGSLPTKKKPTNPKDIEILSQSEFCDNDSADDVHDHDADDDDDDVDADVEDEPVEAFKLPTISTQHSTSTPRLPNSNSEDDLALTTIPLQDISQALLDNQEFQEKLVKNINKALQSSTSCPPSTSEDKTGDNYLMDELETVVKNATEATEIDPIFDEFLKRVVSAQVYPTDPSNDISEIEPQEEQQIQKQKQPQTGSAMAPQPPTIPGGSNTSFGSLIDPNFSISKLIVLNSNESAQKNHPHDPVIGSNADGSQVINSSTLDNQVYFDHSTGQLTCPLILSSDGLLNLPFFINNELIQQLQGDINLETSRIEIPLAEPLILSADQMPPNAVILRSSQKVDNPPKAISTMPSASGSLVDNEIPQHGTTPSTGILNPRSFKSLSTPRKKSHVRTLSFSPMPAGKQLLKRLAPGPAPTLASTSTPTPAPAPLVAKEAAISTRGDQVTIVKNVEIASRIEVIPEVESENSNSVDNQTVIQKELQDTPKRKERSRTVKRVLSKDNEEDVENAGKTNVPAPQQQQQKENEDILDSDEKLANQMLISQMQLKEWKRMRETTQTNFDTYLRQVNAELPKPTRRDPPKKKKRKILSPGVKNNQSKSTNNNTRSKTRLKVAKEKTQASKAKSKSSTNNNKKEKSPTATIAPSTTVKKKKRKQDIMNKSIYNIKIPTPHKTESSTKSGKKVTNKNPTNKSPAKKSSTKLDVVKEATAGEVTFIHPAAASVASTAASVTTHTIVKLEAEREKRTANIACLLDTPFKALDEAILVPPPTPGLVASSLDTPVFKMTDSFRNFSDVKNSNILTPQFAITPGCTLTPFPKDTPRSGTHQMTTDYSSGGSYYRPDESDDLDKIIDKQLRDSAQKRKAEETPLVTPSKCVEVAEEKIPCEPVVLSRVRSIADEDTPQAQVDLHYTLAAGLPELTDDEEDEIPTSALSTTSSSSCSSSASSSSSSSSAPSSPTGATKLKNLSSASLVNMDNLSEISSTEDEDWSKDIPDKLTATANDPLAVNSPQLVNNDWEVRYPVRSWLTPKKLDPPPSKPPIAVKDIQKNRAIRQKQLSDLELKKQRMKAKLSTDLKKPSRPICVPATIKAHSPKKSSSIHPTAKSKITTIRNQYVMSTVTTKEKKVMKVMTPLKITEVDILENSPPGPSSEQIDVLAALNLLSAKKKTPEGKNVKSSLVVASTSSKALKAQPKKKVATKETTPKPKGKVKVKVNIKPSLTKSTKKTTLKSNQSKSSPKRGTSTLRQSSRAIRTPKALENFSTVLKRTNAQATTSTPPGPKKNVKTTPRTSKKNQIVPVVDPVLDPVLDPVVVLKPLIVPVMKMEEEEVPASTSENLLKPDSLKSSPETMKSIETVPPCNDSVNDDEDEDEDDPYELCQQILIDESDTRRFRCFTYSGPDGVATLVQTSSKKSHELNIFLNPNEKHCVKASDEFVLFSCSPKKISMTTTTTTTTTTPPPPPAPSAHKNVVRNIPKKRPVKVSICEPEPASDVVVTAPKIENQETDAPPKQQFNTPPSLTSTPIVPPLKVSELQKAAASRDYKKTEKFTTSRSNKDDRKCTLNIKNQSPTKAPLESPPAKYTTIKDINNSCSSNQSQENNSKSSNKSSRTTTPSSSSLVSSTNPKLPSVEAKSSTELPLDIDVILSKLHG